MLIDYIMTWDNAVSPSEGGQYPDGQIYRVVIFESDGFKAFHDTAAVRSICLSKRQILVL